MKIFAVLHALDLIRDGYLPNGLNGGGLRPYRHGVSRPAGRAAAFSR
jgi:hypothetical protein